MSNASLESQLRVPGIDPRAELVYAVDPLCGWCFAQQEQVARLQRLRPKLFIDVVCGLLVTGPRVRPVGGDRVYLRRGLVALELATGTRAGSAFEERILGPGTYVSDSEPPCRAILAVRLLAPHLACAYAGTLSRAYYVDGNSLSELDVLIEAATRVGVDEQTFRAFYLQPDLRERASDWFAWSRSLGFSSYPSFAQAGANPPNFVPGYKSVEQLLGLVDASRC